MRSVVHRLGGLIVALNLIAVPTVASGQVLHHFAAGEGGPPAGELTAGRDGQIYGTTATGGAGGHGTILRVNPATPGFQVVYSFTGTDPDGAEPSGAALVEGANGFFYGTTRSGGEFGSGTLFRLITPFLVETIFSFPADKADPRGGVILGSDGRLYGTTGGGTTGFGLVYRIDIDGSNFQVLHEFAGGANGEAPVAGVIEATDGFLYGTTRHGSTTDVGTVFKMSKDGASFQTLAQINGPLGFGLTELFDENNHILYLYGVTGEPRDLSSLDPFALSDFVFRVRADGAQIGGNAYQQMYAFGPGSDAGFSPSGRLLLGSDAMLYGTTLVHGEPSAGCVNFGCGAVYRFNPAGGVPFAIHVFKELDGSRPAGGVTEGRDGRIFGLTSEGGNNGFGVVYAIANPGAIPIAITGTASIQPGGQVTYTLQLVSPDGSQQNLSGLDLVVQPSVGLTLPQYSGTLWSCIPYLPIAGAYSCGYNSIMPGGAASQVLTLTFNVSGAAFSVECGPIASPCVSVRVDMATTSANATAFTHVVVLNPHTGQPNQAPEAFDDTAQVFNTTPVVIGVLDNDIDPEHDNLQVNRIIAPPLYGNAVVNANGTITYTPNGTSPAADHFSYRVVDPYGASDVANVTVNQLTGFSVSKDLLDLKVVRVGEMAAGRSVIFGPPDVQGDFEFEELTPAEIVAALAGTQHVPPTFSDPAAFVSHNWFTNQGSSAIYYRPLVPGRVSIARVNVVPYGATAPVASMVIVGEAADSTTGPLHAVDDSASAPPNTSVVINVLANDHPLVPGTPMYTSLGSACDNLIEAFFSSASCHLVRGQVGFNPPTLTQFRFTPEAGFTGTTSFYYASSDQEDCWNQPVCFRESNMYFAKVTVNVGGNAPPTVDAGPSQTVEATGPSGASVTVSGTAFDLDGDPLTFAWTGPCGTSTSATATLACPLGINVLTLEVSDGVNPPVIATTTITVTDTTPPLLTNVPGDLVAEATSPAGAVVTYAAATATDAVGPITISYSHASGSVFPLGTTTVAVTATDGAGNSAGVPFTVLVRDTTPPVLTLPADITLTTSDSNGLAVTYTATAADLVDISVPADCLPFSGSTFPIGSTTVTCTATDFFGNNAIGSFQVTVNLLQPQQVSVAFSGYGSGTVTSTPAGINCPGTCSAPFAMGSSVTLSAAAAAGSTFVGWDGICASAGTGPCTFTVGGATTVTARFLLGKPVVTLRVNGQHPNPAIVTTSGPMLLTLDISESAYTAPVSWYWALIANGQTRWVTPGGLSTTPAPLTVAPPTAMANLTMLNITIPEHTTVTSLLLLVDGANAVVGSDLIVTTRP